MSNQHIIIDFIFVGSLIYSIYTIYKSAAKHSVK